jgi:hypothetical protein
MIECKNQPWKKGKAPQAHRGATGELKVTWDDTYHNCGMAGHWAKDYKQPK